MLAGGHRRAYHHGMKFTRLSAAILAVLAVAVPVLAQEAPQITNAPPAKRTTAVLMTIGVMILVAFAGFMTPKRGHLD